MNTETESQLLLEPGVRRRRRTTMRRTIIDVICRAADAVDLVCSDAPRSTVVVPLAEWEDPDVDLLAVDARVESAAGEGAFTIRFERGAGDSARLGRAWRQAAIRYQRFRPRWNQHSASSLFKRLLERHRQLHDMTKPLVVADYAHALDVWQWTLRVDPEASFALQAAALLHDIERLVTEADARIEHHHATEYQAFKDRHARAGATMARGLLASLGANDAWVARVHDLIAAHEMAKATTTIERASGNARRGPRASVESVEGVAAHDDSDAEAGSDTEVDGDARLLADADALSFFSLNAYGFLRYYGAEHTRRKVAYTLGRMSVAAQRRLPLLKIPRPIQQILAELPQESAS